MGYKEAVLELLMGNEAIALGAVRAGVNLVCGYPGTPSTEVLEAVAKYNPGDIHVEWASNEKAAMEVGGGASFTGARVLVTMKQMGLNVAADPLMCLSYLGVKGGMVVLVADDPGPISSQTEQDTRHFAKFANLPVLDPSTPEEAYQMIQEAFEISEQWGLPVILRPTTRICHASVSIEAGMRKEKHEYSGFAKDPRWVIFPSLSLKNHRELEQKQKEISKAFSHSTFNDVEGNGSIGIVASGAAYAYAREAVKELDANVTLVKIGTPYPFPEEFALDFIRELDKILVVEELDAVIERSLTDLLGKHKIKLDIHGKETGKLPAAGEYTHEIVLRAIAEFLGGAAGEGAAGSPPALPVRPPVMCAGCPHRASFYAVKTAMKGIPAVFTGDIGCYTLGNAKPLDMVDTCLCMGAGVTVAQGLYHMEPDKKYFAFIGDSTFFHTGIPGVVNAVYNQAKITVVVLDNSTTAMTGQQPHPGTGRTMMGTESPKIDIEAMLRASGAGWVKTVDPFDFNKAVRAAKEAADFDGVSAVIYRAPCIALQKAKTIYGINTGCISCKKCIRDIGCPAISVTDGAVRIEPSLCYGCGLCTYVCPAGAIVEVQE